jgi:hypothetical protein
MVICKLNKKTLLKYKKIKPYLDGDMLITSFFLNTYKNTLIELADEIQKTINCMNRQEKHINKQYREEITKYYDILQKITRLLNYDARNEQARRDYILINSPNYIEIIIFCIIFLIAAIILILKK